MLTVVTDALKTHELLHLRVRLYPRARELTTPSLNVGAFPALSDRSIVVPSRPKPKIANPRVSFRIGLSAGIPWKHDLIGGVRCASTPRQPIRAASLWHINLLESGLVPWRRPWTSTGLPRNLVSKKPYRGVNFFLLSASKYVSLSTPD